MIKSGHAQLDIEAVQAEFGIPIWLRTHSDAARAAGMATRRQSY